MRWYSQKKRQSVPVTAPQGNGRQTDDKQSPVTHNATASLVVGDYSTDVLAGARSPKAQLEIVVLWWNNNPADLHFSSLFFSFFFQPSSCFELWMAPLKYGWTPEQAGLINIDDSRDGNEASVGSGFIKNILIPACMDSRDVTHVYKTDYAEGFEKNFWWGIIITRHSAACHNKSWTRHSARQGLKGCK